jgi:EmrB/QacA subfamily drug resistance transporter
MVFAGLMLAMALAALDQNIVMTALPQIVSDLGGLAYLSWVVTAFMLASTMATPLYGKLSDTYGRKPLFYVAIALFLTGGVLSGLSQSMAQLIAFRALQGLGAGGLLALAQTTIGDLLEPRERPKYQSWFTAVWAVCSVAGPLLGGFITSALSWRWVFYINVPVGVAALVLITIALKSPVRRARHKIDVAGILLLMGATSALMLMLSWGGSQFPWMSTPILGLAAAAVVLGLMLYRQERRHPEPILSIPMFQTPAFAIGAATLSLLSMGLFAVLVFSSLYFQLVLEVEPYEAGLLMSPQIAGLIIASVVGGNIISRTGRYKNFLVIGAALAAGSTAGLAWGAYATQLWWIEAFLFLMGIGYGLTLPTLTIAVQNAVSRDKLGQATATLTFTRSLGSSFGVSIAGGLMTMHLTYALTQTMQGGDARTLMRAGVNHILHLPAGAKLSVVTAYHDAIGLVFVASAVVAVLACVMVTFMPELPLRSRDEQGLAEG